METADYLEEYVKRVLKIPYCNFKNIHSKIAYEIIVGLSLMYEMYPFFNRVICAVESVDEFSNHANMLIFSDKNNIESIRPTSYKKYGDNDPNTDYAFGSYTCIDDLDNYSLPIIINKNFVNYFSLGIYKNVEKVDISKIENISKTSYGRRGIYHEFGHLLDLFLHISSSDELTKIIENHDIENEISKYATTDTKELVAEAFSYYIYSKKRLTLLEKKLDRNDFVEVDYEISPLVEQIGQLIDRRYKEFTKFRQIKFISERYNFNKRFSINKNFSPISIKKLEEELKRI